MLTIAGIQLACGVDREENFAKALDLARIAVERGAKIVCFAECFAWPWFPRKAVEANRTLADPASGPMLRSLQLFAEQRDVVVLAPMFEAGGEAAHYNSTVGTEAGGAVPRGRAH